MRKWTKCYLFCACQMFTRHPTAVNQTAETRASKRTDGRSKGERKKNVSITQSGSSGQRNSPRRNLLPLESFRASSWPMELRKIITSATSPSCIVLADLPRPCRGRNLRPDVTGRCERVSSSPGQVNTPLLQSRTTPILCVLLTSSCPVGGLSVTSLPFPPFSRLPSSTPLLLWLWCQRLSEARGDGYGREQFEQARGTTRHHGGGSSVRGE